MIERDETISFPIVEKIGITVPVSAELLENQFNIFDLAMRAMQMTPEQRAAQDRKRRAEVAPIQAAILTKHATILAASDGLRRQILELHAPWFYDDLEERARCQGCDMEGYEAEAPEFPCRSYDLAADARG